MHSRWLRAAAVALAVTSVSASPVFARDWFVRAGAQNGDGTISKPFADPWQALEKCEAGDAIHVTAGKYYGRHGVGTWAIPFDRVQLLGGYDADFKRRDPWANPTELLWDPASKNWPKEERILSQAKDTVIDGVVIDMQDQNQYEDDKRTGRTEKPGESAIRLVHPGTVRNSVILNPGQYGVDAPNGSTVENNLIVNGIIWGISIRSSGDKKTPAVVRNNTVLFSWDFRAPGKGGYAGAAVGVAGPATVTGNLFAHHDNNAVYMTAEAERVSLTKNLFFMNLFSNLSFGSEGRFTQIDDAQMELLEEVGLKSFDGNVVKDPQLPLDPLWMDRYSKRTAGTDGKVETNDWNKFRQTLGLTLVGKGGEAPSGVAPPYAFARAVQLLTPKGNHKFGARRLPLEVPAFSGAAQTVARNYAAKPLTSWVKDPASVDGQPVELIVAVGSVANVSGIPSQYDPKTHSGYTLYDPTGSERATGFFPNGSSAQRAADAATGWYRGTGKPDRLYKVKGVAHLVKNLPKAGLLIESLELLDAAPATAARTRGRDWFVRAGATGGNGSKEKPFRDPYQALEQAEAGDSIHVAEGEYFGKLKAGQWKIDVKDLSLIGGYSPDFSKRNPWKHRTRLLTAADYKGRRGGYTVEGAEDHSNAVIDGFVFDKRGNNNYLPSGDIDYSRSDKSEHIWLSRPGGVIRNCVFLNGAEGAIRAASGQTLENNIFINHVFRTVRVEAGHTDAPVIFKDNTAAFSWDIRFGNGKGNNGHLLALETRVRANVDNNIFAFADNDAIKLMADARDVELTRNVFSHNLWSNVQKPHGWVAVDDKSWAQLADFGWKKLEGNVLMSPALPLEQQWFDVYLSRTAMVPGKVRMDDWNQLREVLGQPLVATGGEPGKGFAPAFAWSDAVKLFPKNPKVTAGARAKDLPVRFEGVVREAVEHDYHEVAWDVARSADSWQKLEGKRVMLKVVVRMQDNQYQLADIPKETYQAFTVAGPEGMDSGGLPLRAYVARGTRQERAVQRAKSYSSGTPDETYVLKGVVRANRRLVVEQIERAD